MSEEPKMTHEADGQAAADAVRAALERMTSPVKETAWGRWHFSLANGKRVPTTARIAGDWVLLDAVLSANGDGNFDPWVLIEANRDLSGLAKYTLDPFDLGTHVQADVPTLGADTNERELVTLATLVKRACEGLERAVERYANPEGTDGEALLGGPGATAEDSVRRTSPPELVERCAEGGWVARERKRGDVVVDLEAGTGYWQARLRPAADPSDPSVTALVPLPMADDSSLEDLPEDARLALGVHLLTSGAIGRLIRAAIDRERGAPCFEVRFDAAPTAGDVNRALCALSVACRFFGREAQVLQSEAVAARYLALRFDNGRAVKSRAETDGRGPEGAGQNRRK